MSPSVDSLRPPYYFTQTLVYNLHVHLSTENRRKNSILNRNAIFSSKRGCFKSKIIYYALVSVIMNILKVVWIIQRMIINASQAAQQIFLSNLDQSHQICHELDYQYLKHRLFYY